MKPKSMYHLRGGILSRILPVLIWVFILTGCSNTKNEESLTLSNAPEPVSESTGISEKEPLSVVEEMPIFPGGDNELLKFIAENTIYPEAAKSENKQGKVVVRFCVTEKGEVNKLSIVNGADPLLDEEAMRVISILPAFEPGKQEGKAVPVWYMLPITFALK